jgi:hypothetical protein
MLPEEPVDPTLHDTTSTLRAAGVPEPAASEIADVIHANTYAPRIPEYVATIAQIARTGAAGPRLRAIAVALIVDRGQHEAAVGLLAAGMPGPDISDLYVIDKLSDALDAVELGVPLELVCLVGRSRMSLYDLFTLTEQGMTGEHVELILASDPTTRDIADALNHTTWDTIATILTAVIALPGSRSGASALEAYTETDGLHPVLPDDIRVTAAILTTIGVGYGRGIGVLPLAAAITGQPWADTAITLLAGAGPATHGTWPDLILGARALEHDPGSESNEPTVTRAAAAALGEAIEAAYDEHDLQHETAMLELYTAAVAGQPWADGVLTLDDASRDASHALAAATHRARSEYEAAHANVVASRGVTIARPATTPAAEAEARQLAHR